MIIDYFLLAWKNLVHRKVRSWLTLLGIFVGVAAVVSLIGLGEGLKTAVSSQFGVSSTEVITVQAGGISLGPPGSGAVNHLTESDTQAIKRLTSVETALPRLVQSAKVEFNDAVSFGYLSNIVDGEERNLMYELLDIEAEKGRMLKDGDTNKIIVGNNILNEEINGKIPQIGNHFLINDKNFEIVGVLKKKGSFIFDNIILMNDKPIKDLLDIKENVDIIAVKVKDKNLMEKAKTDIEKLLRKRRGVKEGEEDFEVQTPEAALSQLNDILVGVQIFIVIIASISIVIGAIGIVNTMFTSVVERRKQIGIMKSIGAKNSDIFIQFFIEAGLMGLIGGFIGTIIGTLISFLGIQGINAFIGASCACDINYFLIFGALIGSFLIGALSGIIPALQAANQNPVESLRG